MKTFVPKNDEQNWIVVDATDIPLVTGVATDEDGNPTPKADHLVAVPFRQVTERGF